MHSFHMTQRRETETEVKELRVQFVDESNIVRNLRFIM